MGTMSNPLLSSPYGVQLADQLGAIVERLRPR